MASTRALLLAALLCACGSEGGDGPAGAGGEAGAGGAPVDAPTWWADVAPIVYRECVSCHVDTSIGAFPLLDYETVSIVGVVAASDAATRRMPPSAVDASGSCNTYADARWLSDEDIATLEAWAAAGAPEGEATELPPMPVLDHLAAGEVSTRLDPGQTYTPEIEAFSFDSYRCFLVDPELDADAFLTAFEVEPEVGGMVHDVTLHQLDTPEAEAAAEALDAADEAAGWRCFSEPGMDGSRLVGAWLGGGGAVRFPEDTGIRLLGGRRMVQRIHYNTHHALSPDRTRVALALAPAVAKEAELLLVEDHDFALPPGLESATAEATVANALGVELAVHGVFPHMHFRGTTQHVAIERAIEGDNESCLATVPSWEFRWRTLHFYDKPIVVGAAERFSIRCTYDTRDAISTIERGDTEGDEACASYLYVSR
jgi:hypothetical protein